VTDDLSELLERNRRFAAQFDKADLPIRPRFLMIILTCVDARVDPAHFTGLELGDAFVMRNAGGRITQDVIADLAVVGALMETEAGGTQLHFAVVRHTRCGAARLSHDAGLQDAVASRLGVTTDTVAAWSVGDPVEGLRTDIELLRREHRVADGLVVSGHVYDIGDGSLSTVVEPQPLRSG
jgi:carbonic anhydrase